MKKNISTKLITIIIFSLILLLTIFLSLENTIKNVTIAKQIEKSNIKKMETTEDNYYTSKVNNNEDIYYLSDIKYDEKESKVEWGSITLDGNLETQYNSGLITLLLNGKKTHFLKGISAHATSTLIYDISGYNYDYFSAFVGVDESRGTNGNGVKFSVYTSNDKEHWDLKQESKVLKGNDNAEIITVNIKDAHYLKLYCHNNGNNASDHAVYANAKLYKEGFVEEEAQNVDFIKTVEEYDAELKDASLADQIDKYELTLLKRNLVSNIGYNLLQAIVNQNKDYETAVKWLMEDVNNLRLYVLGGAPDGGSYYNSIKELSKLYKKYKDDFTDTTKTNNTWYPDLTKGEVYKKMAISLSLTHATKVGYWAQIDHPKNRSDSVERYRIYKKLYDEGKFKVSERQDQTKWYEALTVEEMRYVMNNITDDEELIWFNEYTQKRINAHPGEEEKYLQPHTYIAYVWPNFENPIYHDPDLYNYWDELFDGIFSIYHVTYSTENDHVYKAWMSMRNKFETGAVCGGISKLGCHIRAAHGMPASVISQPGHAAIIYYRKNEAGQGYWSMDNDVSGWAQSGKSEKMQTRMPLGWGDASYVEGWAATYMMLSQDAINDYANYEKSEKIIMTADLYNGNIAKQQEIYEEALKVQDINIDAWWGLINAYNADTTKKEEDYYNLAARLGKALVAYPLPMKNLLDQIGTKLTSVEYSFKFTLLETELLNEGKNYDSSNRANKPDISGITRTVANFLLGQTDTSLASFSFDGANAEKIVLASRYDSTGLRWDYSLDGRKTWKTVTFNSDEPHKWKLSKDEIESITAENDIYIHIVGTDYSDGNVYKIDIENQEMLANLYANDLENRIVGIDVSTTYWRYNEGDDWTPYSVSSPDLTGNKTVQVRQGATGTKLASKASEPFTFTEDNQPDKRKYVRVSDLEVTEFLSESIDGKRPYYAPNAIDGNIYTLWHTDFRYSVIKENTKPFITLKLKEPKYVSALEFMQTKYKKDDPDKIKNVTVYVSKDGKDWTEAGKVENCETYGKLYDITFNESIYAQYIKLDIETYDMFASISMINVYEDLSKVDRTKPTAGIYYSTQEPTNGYVIARLDNPSTEITVTNNDGNDSYVFKENGKFTFEFEDKAGNKGSATAEVTWIDSKGPEANVEYELDGENKLRILLESISEDVYLLDNNNNKISYVETKDGKVSKISYLNSEGNVYKIEELDEKGNIIKTTYENTTGKVSKVDTYVVTSKDGKVIKEYFDENGIQVGVTDDEKETLRIALEQVKTNPLEYTFEESGNYEFKLLDKASNIAYKSIKADYLEDNNIIASDITYNITKLTNKDVVATINPYLINNKGEKLDVEIVNNSSTKEYKFENNGKFVFKYKDASDPDDSDIKEHEAKVDWIDKVAPTAKIKYSTNKTTNEPVVATLTDESEEIVITNNNTSKEFTFTENGNFTFEFEDEAGNEAKLVATVDWIKTANSEEAETGDLNNDGKITSTDLLLLKRHLVAGENKEWILTENEFKAADLNKDNKITSTDLLLLKRLLLSQENT